MFKKSFLLNALIFPIILLLTLTGCGSDSTEGIGYIHFYNASANAPAIFLTVDEKLDSSEADEVEKTYSSIGYGQSTGLYDLDALTYYVELAWQDEDSKNRDDLTMIYQEQLTITTDEIQFIVLNEDITAAKITTYNIPLIDDDNDDDENLFNLRLLNTNTLYDKIDVYISKSDESFNEAQLISQVAYSQLSENQKLSQDQYIFYITLANSNEVLYSSDEIDFPYSSQYVMAVRKNEGAGNSPFVIDKISSSNIVEYPNNNAQAQFRIFNAIEKHDQLPNYNETVNFYLNNIDDTPEVTALNYGDFSSSIIANNGDYSVALTLPDTNEIILQNQLLTLPENLDKTVFFYLTEEYVDNDNDGNVDENGDGIIDEIKLSINSLVVTSSARQGIYDHNIQLINLVDNNDFESLNISFVRSNEIIDNAAYKRTVAYVQPEMILLRNNTYRIYAVGKENSSDLLLATTELTLSENSHELFLIIDEDENTSSGYKITLANQNAE
jgi:hypothetical protein